MPEVDHGGERVLRHGRTGAKARAVRGDQLPGGRVLVLEVARVAHGGKQEVVRQELHPLHLDVVLEPVDFHSALVVDVHILLLRRGKKRFVVQPAHVPHRLPHLDLARELARLPVERREVAFAPAEQEVAPVARVVTPVRAEPGRALVAAEPQLKALARGIHADLVADLLLRHLGRALHLIVRLDHAGLLAGNGAVQVCVCQLGMLLGTFPREVLPRHLGPQLLVPDRRDGLGRAHPYRLLRRRLLQRLGYPSCVGDARGLHLLRLVGVRAARTTLLRHRYTAVWRAVAPLRAKKVLAHVSTKQRRQKKS